jgi:hypothetical protein
MTLHPELLAELLELEVQAARTALGERAGDLHHEGNHLLMTLTRPDGTWALRLDGTHYDAQPYDLALIDGNGHVLPLEQWIPGLGHSVHPVLHRAWACISGTAAYYCYPGHHGDRWDAARYQQGADTLLATVLKKVNL